MLRQATVSELIAGKVSRGPGRVVVVTMRRWPRQLRRALRDEYVSTLSPDIRLLDDFLALRRQLGDHDLAFDRARYERRFELTDEGIRELQRLSDLSRKKDVYLVCQCGSGHKCHRELLLILAREWFGAPAEKPAQRYPIFEKRAREQEPFAIAA
ncbi:MAG: DUF488 domain-containing protein [Oligoflexia bacterium]|nr:DUF488 domain-containing protein [Oligoflexia bacterium]